MRNISWASNLHIRVISEGSCDTEDCCKVTALITGMNYTLLYIYIEKKAVLNCNNISQYYFFLSNKRLLLKTLKPIQNL